MVQLNLQEAAENRRLGIQDVLLAFVCLGVAGGLTIHVAEQLLSGSLDIIDVETGMLGVAVSGLAYGFATRLNGGLYGLLSAHHGDTDVVIRM